MRVDLHIHTKYSCDSEAEIEQYVKQAIYIKMQMICFTDHVGKRLFMKIEKE